MTLISSLLVSIGVAQKTYIGVKAGGHAASSFIEHTIFNLNTNTSFVSGIHGGLFVKYFPKTRNTFLKSGLQLSVNYVQKGWKQVFLNGEPSYKAEMNYLEVPIEAIGYFGNKNNYFITAGFYVEYLIQSKLDDLPTFDDNPTNDPDRVNLVGGQDFYTYEESRDNEIGYGARLSAGIFRDFSFGMLHLEGFFTYSFSNFIDPGDLTDRTPDISNLWTTGVSLGYLIPLKKKK